MSASGGSDSVLRCSSIVSVLLLQNDEVECVVGNGPGGVCLGVMAVRDQDSKLGLCTKYMLNMYYFHVCVYTAPGARFMSFSTSLRCAGPVV